MENFIGLFLILSGYIIGLGSVTVIDTLGFLARKSTYWTESTIRAHKVTKPLIWLGLFLIFIGGILYFQNKEFNENLIFLISIFFILIINGIFLSFYISPKLLERERKGKISEILPTSLQNKIFVSFIISFLGWWGSLLLFTKSSLSL
jgi:hypothetical protein